MSAVIMWTLVVWYALGAAGTVMLIGEPQTPVTRGSAVFRIIVICLIVFAIVTHWEAS